MNVEQRKAEEPPPQRSAPPQRIRTIHDGVTECDDAICCCESEPRWRRLDEERKDPQTGGIADVR